jgi:DNA primase
MKANGYSELELFEAGLVVKGRNGGFRDKFYNRLMFPVIDQKGDVIAFGGRVLGDSEPKYLNSPEIANIFSKRRVLYGINLAKNTKREYFILCEGNIDVITLHQAGFDNAVASMGTSLTEDQIKLMTRFNKKGEVHVVTCYDSDGAGVKATDRAIDELGKCNGSLGVIEIPDGKDVDDFIRAHGAKAFEELLANRSGGVNYKLDRMESAFDLTNDEQRVTYLRQVTEYFASLTPVEREIYAPRIAKATGVTAEFIVRESASAKSKLLSRQKRDYERSVARPVQALQSEVRLSGIRYANTQSAIAEEGLIRLSLLDPALLSGVDITPAEFSSQELSNIFRIILSRYSEGLSLEPSRFAGELTAEEMSLLVRITDKEENLANSKDILADYIAAIRREQILAGGSIEALIAMKQAQMG